MKTKKSSLLKRLLDWLFSILSVIVLLAMLASVLCCWIDPVRWVWPAYFGLAFMMLLAVAIFLFVVMLLLKSRKIWVAILALIVSVPGVIKSFAFNGGGDEKSSLRVLSYNLHGFVDVKDGRSPEVFADDVVAMIKDNAPDVVCFQEFHSYRAKNERVACIDELAERCGFLYKYYNRKRNYAGNVIMSKYPIEPLAPGNYFGDENRFGIMVKVDAGASGSFYVASIHLTTFLLTDEEVDFVLDKPKSSENVEKYGKSILKKLKHAFEKRSVDRKTMMDGYPDLTLPVLLCGDFNDTPLSFTYNSFSKAGFVDSFLAAGRGLGVTYAGPLPLLRIDYIWTKDGVESQYFKVVDFGGSDHYPIRLDLTLK